jgi:hypothetical protein
LFPAEGRLFNHFIDSRIKAYIRKPKFFIFYIQQLCAGGRSSILLFPAEGRLFNHFSRELDERSSFVLSSFPRQGWRARRQSQPCAPKAHPLNVPLNRRRPFREADWRENCMKGA